MGRRRLQSLAAAAAVSLPLLAAGCSSDGAEPAVGTGTAVPDTSTATSTAPGSASGSASTGGSAAPGADAGVHLLGSVTVPTGMRFEGTTVGGLSGIDYDPDSGHYVVISDDRGAHGPTRAYTLELPLDGQGRPGQPRFLSTIPLEGPDGPYEPGTTDTESVRWAPGGGLIYGSEGDATGALMPFIRSAAADGSFERDYPLPSAYLPETSPAGDQVRGLRENLGFEGLALSPDGRTISAITENALVQDGPEAAEHTPSPSRLLRIDRDSGEADGEYVYMTDPLQTSGGVIGPSVAGVSAMMQAGPTTYLTVERSLALPRGFVDTVYLTTTDGADDVAGAQKLPPAEPMDKTRVYRADGTLGNVEGITWGPRLPGGERTLVLVEDDNFGQVGSTAFHVLEVADDAGF